MQLNRSKHPFLICGPVLISVSLTACAPQGLYYWGDYESSLYERYVENANQQTDAYLRNTITEAAAKQRKVPPGVCADYGFLLYKRGDNAGAVEYFQKERALYPESQALMSKLIARIQQKDKTVQSAPASEEAAIPTAEGVAP